MIRASRVSKLKVRFVDQGNGLGRWRSPLVRVYKNLRSKPYSFNAYPRLDPSSVVPSLSSYTSDSGQANIRADREDPPKHIKHITSRTDHNKDAAEENEGRNHVKEPTPTENFRNVEMVLEEHGILPEIPDLSSGVPQAKQHRTPQHQQPIQPKAPEITNVRSIPTNPVPAIPWIAEEVLFKNNSRYKCPSGFIDSGSYGSIFLVRHRSKGDLAALKVVKIEKGYSDIHVGEVGALTRIRGKSNRFVVRQPLGVGDVMWTSDSGHLHLLFDLYIGNLGEYSGRPDVIHERFLGLVIAELHSGLGHLHELGFIHKDLKPPNILIDRDGHCVIADLGGSDIYSGISPTQRVLKSSAGVITMEYAAPEFFQRDEGGLIGYSQAVDLWSLGATLCELITHTIPRSLTRTERDNGDDGYSLQALGLESGNISKTLGQFACPDCIIDVVMELCCISPQKRLDIEGLESRIFEYGWNIPLGHYTPFPVDRSKSAVVLPKGPGPYSPDKMKPDKDATEALAEFDVELIERQLSLPRLDRFLVDPAAPKELPVGMDTS